MERKQIKKDEWAFVLDYLSHGHYGMERSQPVAQVLGDEFFSLLEIIVRENIPMKSQDKIYIGDGKREQVKYIRGRINFDDLTAAAKEELNYIIEDMIDKKPERFLDFFNKSGQITTRLHQLELLPGIGKRHLWAIIDERKVKEFESFDDLMSRVPLLPNPEKMISKRIVDELHDKDKYRIFVPKIEKKKRF